MNQKNKDRDSKQPNEVRRIGRTTYFVNHYFNGNRHLEKVLERLILSGKPLL
ncbi:hypothetical protein ACXZ83_00760 [Streptococcus agalactiae]|uniref:hypothetical protein n=1 Tax=Streptococcus agalactiae TaxID=1311 RepID=UPI0002E45865|nr:hypothetical protein [Streptococcus agalactiae]EPX04609.1 hypothetical protein SAG0163_01605 [Streptococcus agalactiae MRI Z1-215]